MILFALSLLSTMLTTQSPTHTPPAQPRPAYYLPTHTSPHYTPPPPPPAPPSIVGNNDILAFYGHPDSRRMGILGRFTMDELNEKLIALADEYDAANGPRGVVRAFYLVYGTVWPEGEIGLMSDARVQSYIDFAAEHNMIVFLDHQIGRFDPVTAMGKLARWLAHPNVHLALDPEWRTTRPMKEIGSITGDELNAAMKAMSEHMAASGITDERLLVVHQFNSGMITLRERVTTDNYPGVRLIHCADGFGNPGQKRASYANNARATNMPDKGFKLFYNFGIPGAGYDNPLLTPADVMALTPNPILIMYQ